jgi:predicted nucleotidyltransferase
MNIHFTDKILFEKLKQATLVKCKMGSHLYGTNTENSDEDFLHIYATSQNELNSFIYTNHQLQYKENGVDHNFVSLHSFIRNCINGDSTVNFEIIHSNELKNTCLSFLNTNKKIFNTYTIARSFLGFSKRDIKHFSKCSTEYEKFKKLEHIVRGDIIASNLINCSEYIKDKGDIDFYGIMECLIRFKELHYSENAIDVLNRWSKFIDNDRKLLNEKLDNKTLGLGKIMKYEDGVLLNNLLLDFMYSYEFKHKQAVLNSFDMDLYINAFENWVDYNQ